MVIYVTLIHTDIVYLDAQRCREPTLCSPIPFLDRVLGNAVDRGTEYEVHR